MGHPIGLFIFANDQWIIDRHLLKRVFSIRSFFRLVNCLCHFNHRCKYNWSENSNKNKSIISCLSIFNNRYIYIPLD
ncbi:Uncharacterised protein [Chlamydia trachomatis]|nr:Uncharacterised protein [Chlamydia trachomatis]